MSTEPSAYNFELLSVDDSRWTNWLMECSHTDPLSHPEFGKAIASASVPTLHPQAAVISSDGMILAGMMIFCKNQFGLSRWVIPPLVPYTPFLVDPTNGSSRSVSDLLASWLPHAFQNAHAVRFSFQPDLKHDCMPELRGMLVEERSTMIARTHIESALLAKWPKKRRYAFRKAAEKLHFEVSTDWDAASGLIAGSYGRRGIQAPLAPERLTALLSRLARLELVELYLARDNESPAAALVVLRSGDRCYYWLAGSVPGDNLLFLTVKALSRLSEDGGWEIDLVGANIPGIAAFKSKFLPESHAYSVVSWSRPGWIRYLHSVGVLK